MGARHDLQVRHRLRKRQGKVRFRKFHKSGAEHFSIRLYVTGDTEEVTGVTYELHPTFRNRVRHVTNRETDFALDIWTWGEFDLDVTFHFHDGHTESTVYSLQYSGELPAAADAYIDETDPAMQGGS